MDALESARGDAARLNAAHTLVLGDGGDNSCGSVMLQRLRVRERGHTAVYGGGSGEWGMQGMRGDRVEGDEDAMSTTSSLDLGGGGRRGATRVGEENGFMRSVNPTVHFHERHSLGAREDLVAGGASGEGRQGSVKEEDSGGDQEDREALLSCQPAHLFQLFQAHLVSTLTWATRLVQDKLQLRSLVSAVSQGKPMVASSEYTYLRSSE